MAARLAAYVVVAIVAATLIAGLIVGAQRDDNDGPVDLIVRNGAVYTADRRGSVAEAVAIRGNQILRVGSNREIARFQRPQTLVVDARGGAVFPGFNDARLDLVAGGLRMDMADVSDAATAADAVEQLRAWSEANPSSRWVVGTGWRPDQFKNGQPTRHQLDAAIDDRPVVVYGGNDPTPAVWVNSKALKLAAISRKTAEPAEGTIVREGRSGEPSGLLRGAAAAAITALLPPPSTDARVGALRRAIAEANARGITSVQNAAESCDRDLTVFDALRRDGAMKLRVYCAAAVAPPQVKTDSDLTSLNALRARYPDDPLFKTGALSFTVDRPIATGDAALLEPYAGGDVPPAPLVDPDELNRAVRLADAAGWQVVISAHGDLAARMALNAYAHAIRSNKAPSRGRRHRIEQLALVDPADLSRFGPLGVAASLQPPLLNADAMEALTRSLGAERAGRSYPLTSLAAQARLLLGSGWPAGPLNPLEILDRAVNGGTTPEPSPANDVATVERTYLKIKAAVDAYTSAGAWGSFDDQRKGSISPGMLADIVVLSDDVLTTPSKLATTSVLATIFDGKIVYHRDGRLLTPPAPVASLQH